MRRSLRLAAALLLVLLVRAVSPPAATAAGVAWARPVPGPVTRAFAYDVAQPFVRGQHRGVDLAASPGATVRAACAGRVVTARPGQVVTLRCGPWRVTHLPMADVTVRVGRRVAAGARLGTLGAGARHPGLHVGVRRAGSEFGYVDPLAFLPRAHPPRLAPPPAGPGHRRLTPPLAVPPPPSELRTTRRIPRLVRPEVRVPAPGGLAPWPAWAGLVLVLCGALGGGVRWRLRMRRVPVPAATGDGVA